MNNTNQTITPSELKPLLPSACSLIDVREPVEHAESHITGAKLIPLGQLEGRSNEIDRDSTVVLMCRSGKRSEEAREKLHAMGLTNVRSLKGGILAWKQAGLPTDASERSVFPLMRQVQLAIGICVLTSAVLALTVNPLWALLCAFFGAGLTIAGSTGWCGLAMVMSKMPWNRIHQQSCIAPGSCSTPNPT